MEKITTLVKSFTERRFARYVLVGGTTFAIDFVLFSILHSMFGWNILLANTISYWSSIAFNFSMNQSWTFQGDQTTLRRNLILYLSLLVLNFGFSSAFLTITVGWGLNPQIAKITATGLQTIWTYIAYKKVIFK